MKNTLVIVSVLVFVFISGNAQDVTLPGPGSCGAGPISGSWTVPCDVTSVTVQVYGGGGGAGGGGGGSNGGLFNTRGGGGGGGGGYTTITINVTPGSSFSYSIGSGGCGGSNGSDGSGGGNGTAGGNSSFSGTDGGGNPVNLTANGGARGTGGSGTGGSTGSGGGGGTASGGTTSTNGAAGSNGSGGNGGNGGNAAGPGGGAGGASTGANGATYGGGGAGGGNSTGGVGGAGGILITYVTTSPTATPIISSTPATCTMDGTSTITNYDPNAIYTFSPLGPFPGGGGLLGGMTPGTTYTVVVGSGNCASPPSAPFSNAASTGPPAAPAVTTTPPTCSANGTATITNYSASLTYTFTPSGPSAGGGGVISGMTPGTSYTVEATDGSCNSAPSSSFTIGAQLSAPATPTITSVPPTCTVDGSSIISNYNGSLSYIFTPSGPSAGVGGAITGMVTGTNYTVEANDGNCSSSPSASFSNAFTTGPPATPTVSTAPPTCSSDGISTITNYNGAYTYIFTPGGPTAGVGGVISGMTAGTNYTVEASDGSCNSSASASFTNNAQLSTPAVPAITTTPPSCTSDGSSLINNYNASYTYVFTPSGPSAGVGGSITGMVTGTSYTVEADDGNCPSGASASFSNAAQTPPPVVPVVSTAQSTCTSDGTATINNYDANLTYIFTPTGPSVGGGGLISGMVAGTSYTVDVSDGSCNSGQSASFSVSAQLATPVAVVSGSLTYCTGENTTLTASGGIGYDWTDAGGTSIGSSASVTVTQGTYTVTVVNSDGCSDTETVTVTEASSLTITIAGTLSFCPGENTVLTASGGTSYLWSNGSTTASITVTQAGTYDVTGTTGGCSGVASETVTELTTIPVNLGTDISVCEDSVVVLDAGSGYASYVWDSGETTQAITPLTSGSYSVTAVHANGCSESASVNVVFNECIVEEDFTVYIPNAFTPNSDRDNDVFRIYSTNVLELELRIFNRWGEQIFINRGVNSTWDGTYKLAEVEQGVYAYMVDILLQSGYTQTYRGIVTLVR